MKNDAAFSVAGKFFNILTGTGALEIDIIILRNCLPVSSSWPVSAA